MLENRSFDHLLGGMKFVNSAIDGLTGAESCPDAYGAGDAVTVRKATDYAMSFDPGHEFEDIQIQLYGLDPAHPGYPKPASSPASMSGFIDSANSGASAAQVPADRVRIMEYFPAGSLSVMSALAQQFAVFNYWYSSLPGPTWPNRFFVHAATSGGLTDSPGTGTILGGFSFQNGTIYERLESAGKGWRIYHDGTPQVIGIDSLRLEYLNPATTKFREWQNFVEDVQNRTLPEYTFIEPLYNIGTHYKAGSSMHPLDDLRLGEQLVKDVYEVLRGSPDWQDTMLIITFDEHGGFYDHVPPPAVTSTGDDTKYANPAHAFKFDLLGVRVPAIAISAYTQAGTVIGTSANDPKTIFDHTSILRAVEDRFQLGPLTSRDANANSVDVALNLSSPRTDAPQTLPDPLVDSLGALPQQG